MFVNKSFKSIIKTIVIYSIFVMLAINLFLLYSNKHISTSIKALTYLSDYHVIINDESSDNLKAAYSLGASVANDLTYIKKEQEKSLGRLDSKYIISGFIDAFNGNSQISASEIDKNLSLIDEKISEDLKNKFDAIAKENIEEEEKFFSNNRTKIGIKETLSGLQYLVVHDNPNGKKLSSDVKAVTIAYKGMLLNGSVFDQNDNCRVEIEDLIPGLVEALSLMKEGDTFEIYVPATLAYRHHAVGSLIEPYSALIFILKLIKIEN